jgi:hypothetical protein
MSLSICRRTWLRNTDTKDVTTITAALNDHWEDGCDLEFSRSVKPDQLYATLTGMTTPLRRMPNNTRQIVEVGGVQEGTDLLIMNTEEAVDIVTGEKVIHNITFLK